jgi:hypothetical protein
MNLLLPIKEFALAIAARLLLFIYKGGSGDES